MKNVSYYHKLKDNRYVKIVAEFLIVIGIYLVGQIVVSAIIRGVGITTLRALYARPSVLITAYITGGIATLVAILLVLRKRNIHLKDILLRRPRWTDIGYGILGFGTYFLLVRIVLVTLGALIPAFNLNQVQDIGLKDLPSSLLPVTFIALAVLPPLSEELLFRGLLLSRLRKYKLSALVSAILVSVAFGAMHGQWNVSIDTFVLSMVMIYALGVRKSLWVTITMHVLKNSLAFAALFIFK